MTKKIWFIISLSFLLVGMLLLHVFFFKTDSVLHKMNISNAKVDRIEMQHGGTGQKVTLTNSKDIQEICDTLNLITCKRKLGFGKDGFWMKIAMYQGDKQIAHCTLSSGNYGFINNKRVTIVKQIPDFKLINQYFK
ncbi:hypothetical protein RBG61_04850 [Paludicola sp. MB14-C6]|uniref:hypothetical protein n=1 Tax=Paludihabitans sp. MB14-C6 TaxID=3070656 RepID=UPI0027DCC072|nr:hypothetical protein [Paludicola sp. MB14-C6]WMJ24002.1 hypothetical protein RBG61_04850 [Paludicola sp. MB14-C6]